MNLMAYRANFFIWSMVSLGWVVMAILFFEILYSQFPNIAGWTRPMMYVFQGTYFITIFILWGLLWENMENFPKIINTGELDLYLIKPVNTQFLISFRQIDPSNIADLVAGIFLMSYGFVIGDFKISLINILMYLFLILLAAVYFYAAWFITLCLSFYTDRLENIPYLFPGLRQLWRIPHTFYKGGLRILFTYVIPVTIAATVPAQVLLGQLNFKDIAILCFYAFIMIFLSHQFFQFSLKHYSSASS